MSYLVANWSNVLLSSKLIKCPTYSKLIKCPTYSRSLMDSQDGDYLQHCVGIKAPSYTVADSSFLNVKGCWLTQWLHYYWVIGLWLGEGTSSLSSAGKYCVVAGAGAGTQTNGLLCVRWQPCCHAPPSHDTHQPLILSRQYLGNI